MKDWKDVADYFKDKFKSHKYYSQDDKLNINTNVDYGKPTNKFAKFDEEIDLLILVTQRNQIVEKIQKEINTTKQVCDECDYFYKKGLQEAINIINNLNK